MCASPKTPTGHKVYHKRFRIPAAARQPAEQVALLQGVLVGCLSAGCVGRRSHLNHQGPLPMPLRV